jgi:chorismate synthase
MSTFGTVFRVTTFGESHCAGVGAVVDGCPPGLALTEADVQAQLTRRRPGQSDLTTKVRVPCRAPSPRLADRRLGGWGRGRPAG